MKNFNAIYDVSQIRIEILHKPVYLKNFNATYDVSQISIEISQA